jgi:D-psicose/D-tagatose/L-ribulose 3-epimerase
MKIGVNTLVWCLPFSEKDMYIIDSIKEMGGDVIEITPGVEYRKLAPNIIRKKLQDAGLEATVCATFEDSNDISGKDKATRKKGIDYMRSLIDWSSEVGARIIGGPLYSALGKSRSLPAAERKMEFDRSADSLKEIGDYAAKKNLVVAIEPINRFEIDMINTADQAIKMCDQVNSPGIRMMLDTFHMNIEEKNIGDAIRSAKKYLVHLHTCSNDRGTPGEGHIPWKEVRKALRDIKFNGFGVIESFAPGQIAAFANIWRPLAAKQDDVARNGIRFLKKVL